MMAARSTPGRVPRTKCEIAVRAPVLPALTHAQARPACTRSIARRIEESFLRRIASRGLSPIATTWEAATTGARARTEAGSGARAAVISCGSPTSWAHSCASSVRARSAPATYSRGSWSPLITSIAIGSTQAFGSAQGPGGLFFLFGLGALLDHAPDPIETIRRDPVAQVYLTGLWIGRQAGLPEPVVRSMHSAARGRLAALLNGHVSGS